MKIAKGKFETKANPIEAESIEQSIGINRMLFEKSFSGDLEATSVVSMLGMMDKNSRSGAYVALEKIDGALNGQKGSFCLQHSSSMNNGAPKQAISVVPESGTDELSGISGEMIIDIVEGEHFFTFEYSLG